MDNDDSEPDYTIKEQIIIDNDETESEESEDDDYFSENEDEIKDLNPTTVVKLENNDINLVFAHPRSSIKRSTIRIKAPSHEIRTSISGHHHQEIDLSSIVHLQKQLKEPFFGENFPSLFETKKGWNLILALLQSPSKQKQVMGRLKARRDPEDDMNKKMKRVIKQQHQGNQKNITKNIKIKKSPIVKLNKHFNESSPLQELASKFDSREDLDKFKDDTQKTIFSKSKQEKKVDIIGNQFNSLIDDFNMSNSALNKFKQQIGYSRRSITPLNLKHAKSKLKTLISNNQKGLSNFPPQLEISDLKLEAEEMLSPQAQNSQNTANLSFQNLIKSPTSQQNTPKHPPAPQRKQFSQNQANKTIDVRIKKNQSVKKAFMSEDSRAANQISVSKINQDSSQESIDHLPKIAGHVQYQPTTTQGRLKLKYNIGSTQRMGKSQFNADSRDFTPAPPISAMSQRTSPRINNGATQNVINELKVSPRSKVEEIDVGKYKRRIILLFESLLQQLKKQINEIILKNSTDVYNVMIFNEPGCTDPFQALDFNVFLQKELNDNNLEELDIQQYRDKFELHSQFKILYRFIAKYQSIIQIMPSTLDEKKDQISKLVEFERKMADLTLQQFGNPMVQTIERKLREIKKIKLKKFDPHSGMKNGPISQPVSVLGSRQSTPKRQTALTKESTQEGQGKTIRQVRMKKRSPKMHDSNKIDNKFMAKSPRNISSNDSSCNFNFVKRVPDRCLSIDIDKGGGVGSRI